MSRKRTNRNPKENLVNGSKDQTIKELKEKLKEEASKIGLVVIKREEYITLAQCRYLLIDIAKVLKEEIASKFAMLELIKVTLKH